MIVCSLEQLGCYTAQSVIWGAHGTHRLALILIVCQGRHKVYKVYDFLHTLSQSLCEYCNINKMTNCILYKLIIGYNLIFILSVL